MESSRNKFFQVFAGLFSVIALTSCLGPPQNFPIGSPLWLKANPELKDLEQIRVLQQKHKVIVGVFDAGIDYNHPLLKKHIHVFETPQSSGRGYGVGYDLLANDFMPNYQIIDPTSGDDISGELTLREHGTHVSQLVTLNDEKIGIFPVRVLPVAEREGDREARDKDEKAFSSEIFSRMVDSIVHAMEQAAKHDVKIVNMSLGLNFEELRPEDQARLIEKINREFVPRLKNEWKDILIVAAAGNESSALLRQTESIPASLEVPGLISVGALKDKDTVANYTNYGKDVDVYIRGSDIKSAIPGGLFARESGSSMASPLVAHLAAQLKAIDPTLNPVEIRALILNTADERELPAERPDPKVAAQPALPKTLKVRVVNMLKARRKAQEILKDPKERKQWLTPPFEHGKCVAETQLLKS